MEEEFDLRENAEEEIPRADSSLIRFRPIKPEEPVTANFMNID